jgi:hypothetical protein
MEAFSGIREGTDFYLRILCCWMTASGQVPGRVLFTRQLKTGQIAKTERDAHQDLKIRNAIRKEKTLPLLLEIRQGSLSDIFCRIRIEFFLAPGSAEIIGLSLILTLEFCSFFVNRHFADRIDCHKAHFTFCIFAGGIYPFRERESVTTVTELSAIARAANSGRKVIPKSGVRSPAAIGIRAAL